jgi:hypothetical protein
MTRQMIAAAVCAVALGVTATNMSAQGTTATAKPATTKPASAKPATSKPTTAKPATVSATAKATPAKAAPAAAASLEPNAVTMTGCLETDGTNYRLTDLRGNQAPKGRSWKTGFITKRSKPIDVVGAPASLKLKDQVGHTISVGGVRDGETRLKARTVKQVSASCS